MKLYVLTQNEATGYDTYDSVVVCAPDEETARTICPSSKNHWDDSGAWCKSPKSVSVEYIGEAAGHVKQGVVLASFNAG